jgi:Uma2 family endonuclease
MQTALKSEFVSVEDYLAGEAASETRHEYLNGTVYAMAGASREHNEIIGNLYSALRSGLRGTPCRAFFLDLKVRLGIQEQDVFYYPDLMVGCDPRDTQRLYLRYPRLLIEVSSESTERLDRHEKRSAYQSETLEEYVIVAQARVEVTVFRRANNWNPEVFSRSGDTLEFKSLGLALNVSSIYEGISTSGLR